jgi:hypothetical protein
MDTEKWRAAFLRTFNHEAGHTMLRIASGELKGANDDGESVSVRRNWFTQQFNKIMAKYGVAGETRPHDFGSHLMPLNRAQVQSLLSQYATTNLHEMCAEAWAEYILDPEPRAFARAIGELLEGAVFEFLAGEV